MRNQILCFAKIISGHFKHYSSIYMIAFYEQQEKFVCIKTSIGTAKCFVLYDNALLWHSN